MQPNNRNRRLFFLLLIPAAFAALGAMVMLLWNAVLPGIAPVARLDYSHALGLLALCRILFGGFRFGGGRGHWRSRGSEGWQNKWAGMNDEERQKFRAEWKRRCATKGNSSAQEERP